jgi:MinD-like ATPase involved in chromosome partitioning or flagellar assembly
MPADYDALFRPPDGSETQSESEYAEYPPAFETEFDAGFDGFDAGASHSPPAPIPPNSNGHAAPVVPDRPEFAPAPPEPPPAPPAPPPSPPLPAVGFPEASAAPPAAMPASGPAPSLARPKAPPMPIGPRPTPPPAEPVAEREPPPPVQAPPGPPPPPSVDLWQASTPAAPEAPTGPLPIRPGPADRPRPTAPRPPAPPIPINRHQQTPPAGDVPPPQPHSVPPRRPHRYRPDPDETDATGPPAPAPRAGELRLAPTPRQSPLFTVPGAAPAGAAAQPPAQPEQQGGRRANRRGKQNAAPPTAAAPPIADREVPRPSRHAAAAAPAPARPEPPARPDVPVRLEAPVRPNVAPTAPVTQQAPKAPRPVPRRGWRRFVHAVMRINLGLSPDEKHELDLRARSRRSPRGGYQIGVVGLKGGAGKTTVTAALGSLLAQVRGDRILAVDADPGYGNLADRTGRSSNASIADLVTEKELSHYNDVSAYTSVNSVNLEILPAAEYTAAPRGLTGDDWKFTADAVSKFYNLVLADCGAGFFDPVTHGMLTTASAVVIVTNVSVDSARQAGAALDWLHRNGYHDLRNRACVVINHVSPAEASVSAKELVRRFEQQVQPGRVVVLPFDKHIAAGSEIQLELLDPVFKRRLLELAAALSDDFERAGRR